MAARKTATTAASEKNVASVKEETKTKTSTLIKKYEPSDLVLCRSVFPGRFLYKGDKTKMTYLFAQKGDVNYIEYQDLLASLLTRNGAIMAPYIVIDDEELLEQAHWQQLKKLYDKTFVLDDIESIIELPTIDFKKVFNELPAGSKRSVMLVASDMVKDGRLDSINKVSIIDEACGTNLAVMFKGL